MTELEIKAMKYDLIMSIMEVDDIKVLKKLLDYFNKVIEKQNREASE